VQQTVPDDPGEAAAPEPAFEPETPKDVASSEMLHFSCNHCHKPLQARAEFLGRSTRCPDCQTVVTITRDGAGAESKLAYRPSPSVPVAESDRVPASGSGLPFDRPLDLRRRPQGGANWPWLLAGGAAILLLAGGLVAWLLLGRNNMPPEKDLDLVPANAQVVMSIQVGELWRNPTVQEVVGKLPPLVQAMMRQNGRNEAGPGDLERFLIVVENGEQARVWFSVSAHKFFNRQDFLNNGPMMWGGARKPDRKVAGKTYHVFDSDKFNGEPAAMHFCSDYICALGPEVGIRSLIEHGTKGDRIGPLADAIAKARSKNHVVLGLNLDPRFRDDLLAKVVDPRYAALFEMEALTVTLNVVNGKVELEATGKYPDAAKAAVAKKKLEELKGTLKESVNVLKLFMAPAEKQKLGPALDAAANSLTFTQNGNDIVMRASMIVEADAIAELFKKLPGA
jgi:hypothetical protein